MKKLYIVILLCMLICLPVQAKIIKPGITDHEKINVYMFRGHGCESCNFALNELFDYVPKYEDYLTFKVYEVWYSEENGNLYQSVIEYFGVDSSPVPFFVIGDQVFKIGYDPGDYEYLINMALESYQDGGYKDIIKDLIKDNSVIEESFLEACLNEKIVHKEEKKYIYWIVIPLATIISLIMIIRTFTKLEFKHKKKDVATL